MDVPMKTIKKFCVKKSFEYGITRYPTPSFLFSSVPDPDPNLDPHVFGPPGSFYHPAKIVRKTLIPTVL
jgi:hypothetical protein